ncbi:NitrOD5 domain-containing protein [Nitrososphaera sp.]|uniref:NitrOD5 domain-containing protein n=1 Tax=Nitrososphaera sp. TaxID=1971748 RepID=UPI00307FA1EF
MKEIMDAVIDTFSVFGPDTSKVLMFHIEQKFGLKPEEIHKNPKLFHEFLQNLFGDYSRSLELSIYRQVRSANPSHDSEFIRYFERHALQEVKAA